MPTSYHLTGQREESTVGGVYDYGARFYDPTIGRFMQPDTIIPQAGNPQSLNRYSYVLNNPLRYIDPTGRREQDYYVFVQGCLSVGAQCNPETDWANYLAYLQHDILKMGADAFAAWRKTHVRFVTQSNSDPAKLAAAVGSIDAGEGSIFLIGHSAGASTIANYLKTLMDNPTQGVPPISGAFLLNAPIGAEDPFQGVAGAAAGFDQKATLGSAKGGNGLGSWTSAAGIRVLTVSYTDDLFNPKQPVGDLPFYLVRSVPSVPWWNRLQTHAFLMHTGGPILLSYLAQYGYIY